MEKMTEKTYTRLSAVIKTNLNELQNLLCKTVELATALESTLRAIEGFEVKIEVEMPKVGDDN